MAPVSAFKDTTIVLPPDHDTDHRTDINRWHRLRYRPADDQREAPNAPKLLGTIVSGLLQALPPTIEGDTTVDAADLLDDGGADSAALGVVYLRPVMMSTDDESWGVQIVQPVQVAATWAHKTVTHAVVWSIAPDPRYKNDTTTEHRLALVERWDNTANDGAGSVVTEVYEGVETKGVFESKQPPITTPPDELASHPFFTAARSDDQPRRIVAVVHDWENGSPAPIYAQNEGLLRGLEGLSAQEQDDAEMARHRIAMPGNMIGRRRILGPDGVTVLAEPGFQKSDNLLALAEDMTAQQQAGQVVPIVFPDSLTQRERIERRFNELLEACGISPPSIGRNVTGRSDSAAAKRADQQLTMQTVAGPGRRWSAALTDVFTQLAGLNGGGGDVSVKVHTGLRVPTSEAAETVSILETAQAASTETRVKMVHPEWDDTLVAAEVARINGEQPESFF